MNATVRTTRDAENLDMSTRTPAAWCFRGKMFPPKIKPAFAVQKIRAHVHEYSPMLSCTEALSWRGRSTLYIRTSVWSCCVGGVFSEQSTPLAQRNAWRRVLAEDRFSRGVGVVPPQAFLGFRCVCLSVCPSVNLLSIAHLHLPAPPSPLASLNADLPPRSTHSSQPRHPSPRS